MAAGVTQYGVAGWVWFNANKECDWRVNSDANSLAAFKAMASQTTATNPTQSSSGSETATSAGNTQTGAGTNADSNAAINSSPTANQPANATPLKHNGRHSHSSYLGSYHRWN